MAQKFYTVPVHATVFIALPVNQIADGIHTQSVHMILLQPVIRTGLKETSHLASGMIKVTASPFTLSYILMRIFIQRCAIVIGQRISIYCKMHWHKVQNDSNVRLMQLIHHLLQILCCSISGRRCIESCRLISPGFITRMFI